MKNKTTIALYSFLLLCCFSFCVSAQQNVFDLEIVNYSDKPDASVEHLHLLSLKNNSNKTSNFDLSSNEIACKAKYNDVISNKIGKIDSDEETLINTSSVTVEIYNRTLSKKVNKITLNPNESISFYVKTTRQNNTETGTWKCLKITANLIDNKNHKKIGKSVIIRSFIPNPNILGH
ncbi:hypothetical protein [Flavivirga algicola]|uniref:Uncharacterized protein n=1 Tax=Flavivirga algicola TaxID=2729136 RepID=A0ABX1S0T1_9FLAO|nr:hypothetical protein [Flavivirga algicola]NMH89487.1 hypothetical protein [Flavivirga algicola]